MKLAKQIIMLSAVAILAIGLSFVLISSIVIGSQASIAGDLRKAELLYGEMRKEIRETHQNWEAALDLTITNLERQPIEANKPDDYTGATFEDQAKKDEAIAAAKLAKENAMKGGFITNPITGVTTDVKGYNEQRDELYHSAWLFHAAHVNAIRHGGTVDLDDANIAGFTGEVTYLGHRARLETAFMYDSGIDLGSLFGPGDPGDPDFSDITLSSKMHLTPMGALMVSGIAMTLVGAALVVTVVVLNKNEAKTKKA